MVWASRTRADKKTTPSDINGGCWDEHGGRGMLGRARRNVVWSPLLLPGFCWPAFSHFFLLHCCSIGRCSSQNTMGSSRSSRKSRVKSCGGDPGHVGSGPTISPQRSTCRMGAEDFPPFPLQWIISSFPFFFLHFHCC